ncbi:MAG TPA: hypothetical protein VD704_00840 [Gaiellaceae bacterium]|nr:hypothetical protein [Gaiellaceae bacterium]
MPGREERVARNESLFREVNERIREVSEGLPRVEETEFLCECGDRACTEPIRLTLPEYEQIRSESRLFAVVPGHVEPTVETVVRETDRFAVVRKTEPEAAEIVDATDPRS